MNDKVNILGSEYSIEFKELKDDGIDGYCDYSSKHIVIRSDNANKIENFEWLQKKQLRHEIIHAFMAESGLQANWQHLEQFGHEETVVDWFAVQSPKIFAVYLELGLIEIGSSNKIIAGISTGVADSVISEINRRAKERGSSPIII